MDFHRFGGTLVAILLRTTKGSLLLFCDSALPLNGYTIESVSRATGDCHLSWQQDTNTLPNHGIIVAKYTSLAKGTDWKCLYQQGNKEGDVEEDVVEDVEEDDNAKDVSS